MAKASNKVVLDIQTGRRESPHAQNGFDRNEGWIQQLILLVFIICASVSGFATFTGIDLFLDEVGAPTLLTSGTSVILTIAVTAILMVGWSVMYSYGPEARTPRLKGAMLGLGGILLALTLCVSSLPNLLALVGPASKLHSWRDAHAHGVEITNAVSNRALAIARLRPGWDAARQSACQLAGSEKDRGQVSGVGGGVGPVSVALSGVCAQTQAFLSSMDASVARVQEEAAKARQALDVMRGAIRDRSRSIILREDTFLDGGDVLNTAVQNIRAADLTGVLEAGALQVEAIIAELGAASAFDKRQVEMVAAIKEGMNGLVLSTRLITGQLKDEALPEFDPVTSPDFLAAIFKHWERYVPVVAAAVAIDLFTIWALMFVLISKAGKTHPQLRGQFDRLIESDTLSPLEAITTPNRPKRRWFPWFRRRATFK